MALNGYLPREGDILTIRAIVKYDVEAGEDRVHIRPFGAHTDSSVPLKSDGTLAEVTLYCRHWSEGDLVIVCFTHRDPDYRGLDGQVLAVFGEAVWVKFGSGTPQTVLANDLTPAPEEETQP